LGALAFGAIQLAAVEAMHDLNVIVGDVLPLEREDFSGPHAGKQSQLHDQLFA
jgi:hypothetical protein